MQQPLSPRHPSSRSARRRLAWPLLLALAAAACDGDGPTGPRLPAPGPRADGMRLVSMTTTFQDDGSSSRNSYIYDAAGRLVRVNFEHTGTGPGPFKFTQYAVLAYSGNVLEGIAIYQFSGAVAHHIANIRHEYDGLGYLVRRELETDDQLYTIDYRYDAEGRRVRETEQNGEVTEFRYDSDGNLDASDKRFPDGTVFRVRYEHDRGRNPFHARSGMVDATLWAFHFHPYELSPANMVRHELRVDDATQPESWIEQELEYDGAGRPLRVRQAVHNASVPEAVMRSVIEYAYEPVPGQG